MANVEEKVEKLIKQTIENEGYELYDVEYSKEGKDYYLRVFIDNIIGINLEDCEKVNNAITGLLDEADYLKDPYFLEVSSPGVERTLRKDLHLAQNIGNDIKIKLFKKDENGNKEYMGELDAFDKDTITINTSNARVTINRKDIAHMKTVYSW